MAGRKAFLIDGTACCYRAFYAIRQLSTTNGRPTNAVYGFTMILRALKQKERPDYLAVAFDVGKPTVRHQQFAEYKIQRKPMPEALIGQLPLVKSVLTAYRIPVFELEGYEGEDVLASLTRQLVAQGIQTFLVTSDKDALQLVNSHISVYNPNGDPMIVDAEAVRARYGIDPQQMVDLLALMGDESDNIPGASGIGEKTASQLLQRFGSLKRLYQHLDEVESVSIRQRLSDSRAQVELSRQLACIHDDLPLTVVLEDLKVQEPDWQTLRVLFRELEFKRLLKEMESHIPVQPEAQPIRQRLLSTDQLFDFQARLHKAPSAVAVQVWMESSPGESETSSPAHPNRMLLAIATEPDEACFLWLDSETSRSDVWQPVVQWLEDPQAKKVAHDMKRCIRLLEPLGIHLRGIAGDSRVAAYLLNPTRAPVGLNDLCEEYLGQRLKDPPDLEPESLSDANTTDRPLHAQQVTSILSLHQHLLSALEAQGLLSLYTDLELPLVEVLAQMESVGIAVDLAHLSSLRCSMDARLVQLTQELYALSGCAFNLNSPKQLAQVLFERLHLPIVKRTKTGPSTDSEVLHQLAQKHPLAAGLLEYRELSKLVSTYLEALPRLVNPSTGRIHSTFNQAITATGRLSSSEPNLQNIPVKTELGRLIRKAFIPGLTDGLFVAADYSQIELRILAHLSDDEQLIQAFREGRDIHRYTASLIYGLPEQEIQPEQRNAMKAVNFGILYGMSSHGLSKELGISFNDAQRFIESYFQRYPRVRSYMDAQITLARRDGFVQTLLGRRRVIAELSHPDPSVRQFGERIAINTPIQGTAADLIKRAMVQLAEALARERLSSRLVLQVHDELVLECPRKEQDTLVSIVRRIMEGALSLKVPLVVTVKSGPNWLDLSPCS